MLILTKGLTALGLLFSVLGSPGIFAATLTQFEAVSFPLQDIFDNQAASPDGSANFDGRGGSFDSTLLPPGPFVHDGVTYETPSSWGTSNDNVIANGQVVSIDPAFVHELHFLYAGDAANGVFGKSFTLNFEGNRTQDLQFVAKNWWRWADATKGEIRTEYHFENNGTTKNLNVTQIYQWSTAIQSEARLESITLPLNNPAHRLHLFGMAYTPSAAPPNTTSSSNTTAESEAVISVRRARFTTKWELLPTSNDKAQVVEVTLANLLPTNSLSASTSLVSNHTISVTGDGISTVRPGSIVRLVPGDQVRVDVLVTGSTEGKNATVEVRNANGDLVGSSPGWQGEGLVENWTADREVLDRHEAPTWWKKAKYGIFIHWGVYSFPAWAPSGTYAEWYNWNLHNPANASSPVWEHHLETYGPDLIYDDFIANFTASKFNASAWVDLFDRAGAKYFVFVTKHHDGFALFDTKNTTHRSSVHLGPQRDFLQELMETSKREKPDLHRGTYYSLPEWFSPDSAKYGYGSWPGGLAHNAFNSTEIEPYTGRLNISDYIDDLQFPQMVDLATSYDTEIMWCDIGGPNRTLDFAAQFFNHAASQGRQVTLNNRCADVPDFDTPEYATFGAIQPRDWESNEGMDPFSYGLNSRTNASQYKNATTIIQTLVDIVSKNGNFLLDVGPNAEGEIIAPMANNLLDAGRWIDYAGECVFDTDFWFQTSQDLTPVNSTEAGVRFTTTPTSFCAIAFNQPTGGELVIQKRLPLLPGDKVFLMHPDPSVKQTELQWNVTEDGRTTIQVTDEQAQGVRNAWAFQIQFNVG
ncbi:hypothetical protein D9756_009517 [Leucocoprinus leucothites]|uniref:alpha-L-fucosidase n=1 Tax=Leucocoprinus leucothites TaxID=201217 RepID=A0A8H5FTH2_9AGAR|nr:hypothetical protein D9756_009517 [Leucoagaricus leucothites]